MRPSSLRPIAKQSILGASPMLPQSSLGSRVAHGAALLVESLRLFFNSVYGPSLGFAPFRF